MVFSRSVACPSSSFPSSSSLRVHHLLEVLGLPCEGTVDRHRGEVEARVGDWCDWNSRDDSRSDNMLILAAGHGHPASQQTIDELRMMVEILTERGLSSELITCLKYRDCSAKEPLIDFEERLKRLDDRIHRSNGLKKHLLATDATGIHARYPFLRHHAHTGCHARE